MFSTHNAGILVELSLTCHNHYTLGAGFSLGDKRITICTDSATVLWLNKVDHQTSQFDQDSAGFVCPES